MQILTAYLQATNTQEVVPFSQFQIGSYGKTCYSATPSGNWTDSTGLPSGKKVGGLIYGLDAWFANSANKVLYTSTDGQSWSVAVDIYSTYSLAITKIEYLNGKIIVLDSDGAIVYSADGTNWTSVNLGLDNSYSYADITYGAGTWVIVGTDGIIYYSTDFSTWNDIIEGTADFKCVKYLNGAFYAGAANGTLYKSTSGASWTAITTGASRVFEIVYGNETFVINAGSGTCYYSTDGTTWTSSSLSTSGTFFLAYGAGYFIAVRDNGYVDYSTDGVTWTAGNRASYSIYAQSVAYSTED